MRHIELHQVNRDNTNIRKYSDSLWRALRKERFKKANPDKFVNEMAAEHLAFRSDPQSDFKSDIERFSNSQLSEREAKVFSLFIFGGKLGQAEIGQILGVCQATVANDLKCCLELFKRWYFEDGEYGYVRD